VKAFVGWNLGECRPAGRRSGARPDFVGVEQNKKEGRRIPRDDVVIISTAARLAVELMTAVPYRRDYRTTTATTTTTTTDATTTVC